jgi:hypothetical protein
VLEETEVRATGLIQCDNLTIDYGVVGEISESVKDQGILSIEGISPSGKQVQPASRFHGDGSISIEFDFEKPVRAVRELRTIRAYSFYVTYCKHTNARTAQPAVCPPPMYKIMYNNSKAECVAILWRLTNAELSSRPPL